jgi:hypothetical protein
MEFADLGQEWGLLSRHSFATSRGPKSRELWREFRRGGMAEWSMAVVLKTTVRETVPGVRIPLPPPFDSPSIRLTANRRFAHGEPLTRRRPERAKRVEGCPLVARRAQAHESDFSIRLGYTAAEKFVELQLALIDPPPVQRSLARRQTSSSAARRADPSRGRQKRNHLG